MFKQLKITSFKSSGKWDREITLDLSETNIESWDTDRIREHIINETNVIPPYTFEFTTPTEFNSRLILSE